MMEHTQLPLSLSARFAFDLHKVYFGLLRDEATDFIAFSCTIVATIFHGGNFGLFGDDFV